MKINNILEEIKKKYGQGSIANFNDDLIIDIESISTGCIGLDKALQIGGIPKGKITEIYGPSGVGKTSLAVHIASEAQKQGDMVAYIDVENAVNTTYFTDLGVDISNPDKFILSQPNTAEEALDIVEMIVKSNQAGLIVVDSVAALVPIAEAEGEMAESTISLQARLLSKAMRRLSPILSNSKTAVIFINQIRDNVGVFGYGPKTTTPGGKAIPFYSSLRIELAKIGQIKNGDDIIGSKIKAKFVKSRICKPFQEIEYDIIFGEGISNELQIIQHALEEGIMIKSGAWFSYNDKNIAQGLEKTRLLLKGNRELREELLIKLSNK